MKNSSSENLEPNAKKFPCLIQYSGAKIGRRFNLDSPLLVIGSDPNANIIIDEPSIFPEHAQIKCSESGFLIEAIGDAKGIMINDKPISGSTLIPDAAIIQVGAVILKFFPEFSPPSHYSHAKAAYLRSEEVTHTKISGKSSEIVTLSKTMLLLGSSLGMIILAFYLANIDFISTLKLTPLLLLIGTTFGFMLACFPLPVHVAAIRVALTGRVPKLEDLHQALIYFQSLGQMSLVSGFLGFVIAMTVLIEQSNDVSKIGQPVALGILCLAYGIVIRLLAYGKAEQLRKALIRMPSPNQPQSNDSVIDRLDQDQAA